MTVEIAADTPLPFAMTRPVHVASVGLRAKDVVAVAAYYRSLLGLATLAEAGGGVTLGAGGTALLEIEPLGPKGLPDDPRSAGLFHTAFLLPSRADLGRWILRASEQRLPVDGMSDHLVSEAIYLTDPEGNGVEIYADRPPEGWRWKDGRLEMATLALDLRPVVASAGPNPEPYGAAPAGLRIGHVHLRAGDPAEAERWWTSAIGLDVTAHYPGATFLASGGYHHHIAANSWQSRGAGPRDPGRSGLSYVALSGSGVTKAQELADPWGTVVRLQPGS